MVVTANRLQIANKHSSQLVTKFFVTFEAEMWCFPALLPCFFANSHLRGLLTGYKSSMLLQSVVTKVRN